jgi:hypothetical protein
MFLESDIYSPANGTTYQVTTADLAQHMLPWMTSVSIHDYQQEATTLWKFATMAMAISKYVTA